MDTRECDTMLPPVGGVTPTSLTTESPKAMSRATSGVGLRQRHIDTIVQLIIVATLSIAVFFGMTAYNERTHAWIILDFKTTRGHLTQMAFSNPDTLNEDECRESLPKTLEFLISTAIQQTPSLRRATVIGARCMMSVNDPIKRSGKPKS